MYIASYIFENLKKFLKEDDIVYVKITDTKTQKSELHEIKNVTVDNTIITHTGKEIRIEFHDLQP